MLEFRPFHHLTAPINRGRLLAASPRTAASHLPLPPCTPPRRQSSRTACSHPTPRGHLHKPSPTKVRAGIGSPRPPLCFPCFRPPPTLGRRRPPSAGAALPPSPVLDRGEEEGQLCSKPPSLPSYSEPLSIPIISLSPSYFKTAPRLIVNYELNHVHPLAVYNQALNQVYTILTKPPFH
jgi:hypothetical protein